jgi:hypothetical protein
MEMKLGTYLIAFAAVGFLFAGGSTKGPTEQLIKVPTATVKCDSDEAQRRFNEVYNNRDPNKLTPDNVWRPVAEHCSVLFAEANVIDITKLSPQERERLAKSLKDYGTAREAHDAATFPQSMPAAGETYDPVTGNKTPPAVAKGD